MYEMKIMKQFAGIPVFSLSDVSQIIKNKIYAKKFLKKMLRENKISKIKKNTYTLHDDPLLVSTFLAIPSYITGVSALSFHKLISQIPNEVFCATNKTKKSFSFNNVKINFMHTEKFFGFKKEKYEGFDILIAEPEKAIIDSFSVIPVSVFEEAFSEINKEKMLALLKKIKKSSVIKRVGYLMEKNGFDVYPKLKKLIDYKYIALEPLREAKGMKNKKWGLIINTK